MRQASWISAMRSCEKPRRESPILLMPAKRIVSLRTMMNGRDVLSQQRAALNHDVVADMGPLVDGGVAADDHQSPTCTSPASDTRLAITQLLPMMQSCPMWT